MQPSGKVKPRGCFLEAVKRIMVPQVRDAHSRDPFLITREGLRG